MYLQDLRAFESDTSNAIPGFKVCWKDTSRLQRVLGWLVKPFNPDYLTRYTTTLHPNVWFPSKEFYDRDPTQSFLVLAHERVHLADTMKRSVWFRVSYLLPQILAIPALVLTLALIPVVGWKALGLLGLVALCLAPWGSPWRTHWEQRGYAMTLACAYWLKGEFSQVTKDLVRRQFFGWSYYRMAWRSSSIDAWFAQVEKDIRSGDILKEDVYNQVHEFLKNRGMARK